MLVVFLMYLLFNVRGPEALMAAVLTVGLSTVPDLDLEFMLRHRGVTHSFAAGAVVGFVVGAASSLTLLGFLPGFLAGFGGVALHLLGDLLTYTPLRPLWPLSRRRVSLKLFKSNNRAVNHAFLLLGAAVAGLYLVHSYAPQLLGGWG